MSTYTILNKAVSSYVSNLLVIKYGSGWQNNPDVAQCTGCSVEELSNVLQNNALQLLLALWADIFNNIIGNLITKDDIITLLCSQQQEFSEEEITTNTKLIIRLLGAIGAHADVLELKNISIPLKEHVLHTSIICDEIRRPDADISEENNPFICPITLQIMEDPVITPQGICFERQAILDWVQKKQVCPLTNNPLTANKLITCYALRNAIADYKKMVAMKQDPGFNSNSNYSGINNTRRSLHQKPEIKLAVAHAISNYVEVWSAATICSVDHCPSYPEGSKYIVFPESTNFLVDRCTGYICIENKGGQDISLISRERGALGIGGIGNMFNVGARAVGSYVLHAHTKQGFDFRGYYCIEIPCKEIEAYGVNLLIYDFATKGGGKGNWLNMG